MEKVHFGSLEHLIPIGLWIVFVVILIIFGKKVTDPKKQWKLIHHFSIFVSLIVITYHLNKLFFLNYRLDQDLPLYLCSLLAIIIPFFTYYKKYWMFEILVFWIIAGTLQAVITPDIKESFPSFDYFRYWIVHLGLLTVIFYVIFVIKWKPKFKSVFKSYLALQVYFVLMIIVNFWLSSNYFYLNRKPETATILDYMGDWPWYIIVGQLIIIPYFLLIYLPFYLTSKKR